MEAPILRFDRYKLPERHNCPPVPAVWLEITRGRVRERKRPVWAPVFLIGTAADCDLVLGDPQFPEAYAYVLVQNGEVTTRRVGGGPELIVNGEVVETATLVSGDRLGFGPFELALQMQSIKRTNTPSSEGFATAAWPWLARLAET